MSDSLELGEPIELPWWVFALGLPPLVVAVLAAVMGGPAWARLLAIVLSVLMIGVLVRVSRRVASANMQSVWVSLAFAFWAFGVVTWIAAAVTANH